jgi:quercetin dioxygenase-like cupin family protein
VIRLLLVAVVLLSAACAKGTSANPLLPPGVTPTPFPQPQYVGLGKFRFLAELTEGPRSVGVPFVTFVEVRQAPGTFVHGDVPGFVYSETGAHILWRDDGERQRTVEEGTAHWVEAGTEHRNVSSRETVWYFVAARSINQRDTLLPYPTYKTLYATPDLTTPPADKPLVHQLGLITMAPGGRTSSHSHGGTETFYVIRGTVELALNNGTRTTIAAGQGGLVKPGLVMQMRVVGDAPVTILTYFITPQGEPWQTNLETLP